MNILAEFQDNGFVVYRNDLMIKLVTDLRRRFERIYMSCFGSEVEANRNVIKRFGDDIRVQSLFVNQVLIDVMKNLQIVHPVFCGPVVTHYTCNDFTGRSYGLPLHQDWPSMGSSNNSAIVWCNLQNSGAQSHSVAVAPGKHKNKLLPGVQGEKGYVLKYPEKYDLKILEVQAGELLIMSPFLPHKTYVNDNFDGWKLSLSRRVDDFSDPSWAARGYCNAYANTINRDIYLV